MPEITSTSLWGRIKSFFSSKSKEPSIIPSVPFVLSWLYYDKSFEGTVDMIDKQMKNPKADNANKQSCSFVARQIIDVSIKNGFRTRADWNKYFAMNEDIEKDNMKCKKKFYV